jgi:hypothetical protein
MALPVWDCKSNLLDPVITPGVLWTPGFRGLLGLAGSLTVELFRRG